MSLYARWGCAVMRQMDECSLSLREWGRGILAGWRRVESAIWRLVAIVSQMGVSAVAESSSSRMLRLPEDSEASFAALVICWRRALEAFRVWEG